MPPFDDLKVLSGNAHLELAKDICKYLGTSLASSEAFKFSNDNTFVRIKENIRGKDVFIVQPLSTPVNDNLMELLIMVHLLGQLLILFVLLNLVHSQSTVAI